MSDSGGGWKRAKTSENASRAAPLTSNCSGTYSTFVTTVSSSSLTSDSACPLGSYT